MKEIPKIGETYNCFDDGKITESRKYQVKITEIIPFRKVDDDLLKIWEVNCLKRYWKFKETDYFIKSESNEYPKDSTCIFARSIDNSWFGLGDYWNSGLLDVDGSLTKWLLTNKIN